MTQNARTLALLRHLATRPGHDEVKADFRQLLLEEFGVEIGALEFERRVPEVRGRLDALIGRTIFEAKSDLAKEWPDVTRRMPDYIAEREREEGERFVGIASDGQLWVAFELSEGVLVKLKETKLDPEKAPRFLAWLDGVIALKSALPPDPLTVRAELGQDSVAYQRAHAQLAALWQILKDDPAVALKRQLWAQLLKLVYGKDVENDALWFQHTFLVIVAKAIALAVLDMREDDPRRILSGEAFQAAGIFGAVESDFFDWIVAAPEGEALVARIVAHVRRFRLRDVESDILKVLYESLIDAAQRHGLGEYYTPDWLAAKVVRNAVDRPLEQKVLDPACGSGTFLFHAIRHALAEAEESGLPAERRADEVTTLVAGIDIHPVAVIIARVTYLLALLPVLSLRQGSLTIPVYLGDAMQLSVDEFYDQKKLVIRVPASPAGHAATTLEFPELLCRDPELFDAVIEAMTTGIERGHARALVEQRVEEAIRAFYARLKLRLARHSMREYGVDETRAVTDAGQTYLAYRKLCEEGRDTVWSYVARNLSRPLAMSAFGGFASVLVGNPPWVAFRHMSTDLQTRFKELAKGERVHVGGKLATQNDLCALFTVRAAGLYLRAGGRIAFVLPLAVLTRGQFERLRAGSFHSARIAWDEAWTMDDGVQPLFPVPACAVFGRRRNIAKPLPDTVRAYGGTLPMRDAPEEIADRLLTVRENIPRPLETIQTGGSIYRKIFRNGATLFPRVLVFVDRKPLGKLGGDPSRPQIISRRSTQEKEPWKLLPGIEDSVEIEFLRPILLGESILPYRVFREFEGIVPFTKDGKLLDAVGAGEAGLSGLNGWMRKAENLWSTNAESGSMTLIGRWNYHNELGAQYPIAPLRVTYAASGSNPAACILREQRSVIEHKLYWAKVESEPEAHYLTAILNSETARARTEALQSRGQFGARDFDKVIWTLPIPRFDPASALHADLAAAAAEAEAHAARVELPASEKFQRARKRIRDALIEAGLAPRIDALVARLLDHN